MAVEVEGLGFTALGARAVEVYNEAALAVRLTRFGCSIRYVILW